MPDLDVEKTEQHLRSLVWGAVLGGGLCALAFVARFTPGAWQSPNDLVSDPGHALVYGFFLGSGAHEIKLWVGRRFSRQR